MKPEFFIAHGGYSPGGGMATDAKTEIKAMEMHAANDAKPDYWWQDAGWYMHRDDDWTEFISWDTDSVRFPNGLREVADFCHGIGVKSLLWFDPGVERGTAFEVEHPDWACFIGDEIAGMTRFDIDECREWWTNRILQILRDNNIDVYREDCNRHLLRFWQKLDAPDRRGVTEIKHDAQIRKMAGEWRKISPITLNGDYYPLTLYSIEDIGYIAWQFHLGDGIGGNSGEKGCVRAFRRAKCGQVESVHKLRGLDPAKTYIIENFDGGSAKMSGKQLMEEGLRVRIEDAPKAVTFYYYEDVG